MFKVIRAGFNMRRKTLVNAPYACHYQRNDIGVRNSLLIVEEGISELHLDIAARITVVRNDIGQKLIVRLWHGEHRSSEFWIVLITMGSPPTLAALARLSARDVMGPGLLNTGSASTTDAEMNMVCAASSA